MLPARRRIAIAVAKLYDLAVIVFSFGLASVVVAETPATAVARFLEMQVKIRNFALFSCFLLACHITFCALGLYKSHRLSTRWEEMWDAVRATLIASLTLFSMAHLFHIAMITPLFMLFFWGVSTSVTMCSRLLLRNIRERVRAHGRDLRHLLVVGTNARAVRFVQRILRSPELGYTLVGFVDDGWFGLGEFQKNGYKLVADLEGFLPYLRTHVVDEVAIALPMESAYAQARRVAAFCEEQGINVRLLPDVFDLRLARTQAMDFEDHTVITLSTGSPENWELLLKRPLDILLSVLAILTAAPVGLLAALAIKLTSPGPVFFRQERVGLNKRKFRLFKFRTMVPDAEKRMREIEHLNEVSGPVFKVTNDPRITPVGKLLRKTSIDELPQLLNVLKGDMSMVGPRPLPVRDYNGFQQDWQRRRFSVRPGITCLWQVNGRSSIAFEQWMKLDMQYIDHWSLGLDLKILAKTIPAVLKGAGAS
jgi:exopolysaccharide biosynthesis polyprenyl glycosylphosphotransferase